MQLLSMVRLEGAEGNAKRPEGRSPVALMSSSLECGQNGGMLWLLTFLRNWVRLSMAGESFLGFFIRLVGLAGLVAVYFQTWLETPVVQVSFLSDAITWNQLLAVVIAFGFVCWQGGKAVEKTQEEMSAPQVIMEDVYVKDSRAWTVDDDDIPALHFTAPFLKARLVNMPKRSSEKARVVDASYRITFFDNDSGTKLLSVNGKWPHKGSPDVLETGKSTTHFRANGKMVIEVV